MAIITKDQATQLINQIVTGGNYTATEMRTLLTNLLDSIYDGFFLGGAAPSSTYNQSLGYKAGSMGLNYSNSRYYVCTASSATTASWARITNDTGIFQISATSSQSYTVPVSASTVIYSGSQNTVTVNLPIAANSYAGKTVKVFFSAPAQNAGSGVTFVVPETSPYSPNSLAANVYTSNSLIEFVYTGSAWTISQYIPTVQDLGIQELQIGATGLTTTLNKDTALVRLTKSALGPSPIAAHDVLLPAEPYAGKIVKIMTSPLLTITTLTVKNSAGATQANGTLSPNQAVEFYYSGSTWMKIAPTIIW